MLGIFLDTETNGLNPQKHRILEIAYKFIDVRSGQQLKEFQSILSLSKEEWEAGDKESLSINGFTWTEVSKGQPPKVIAKTIQEQFQEMNIRRGSSIFICQNPSFDRAFFSQLIDVNQQEKWGWPYHWLDLASMYWAKAIVKGVENKALFPWNTGISKDHIAMASSLPPENKPHRAMNGVNHLLLCYKAVVGFPDL